MLKNKHKKLRQEDEFVSVLLTAKGQFLSTQLNDVVLFRGVAGQPVVVDAYDKMNVAQRTQSQSGLFSIASRLLSSVSSSSSSSGIFFSSFMCLQIIKFKTKRIKLNIYIYINIYRIDEEQWTLSRDERTAWQRSSSDVRFTSTTIIVIIIVTYVLIFCCRFARIVNNNRFFCLKKKASKRTTSTSATTNSSVTSLYCSLTFVAIPYRAIIADCMKVHLIQLDSNNKPK